MFDFCCNGAATAWKYTYGHTLSLHDARPFLAELPVDLARLDDAAVLRRLAHVGDPAVERGARQRLPVGVPDGGVLAAARSLPGLVQRLRSDEHTSELQSLMRISYAVFCLKKKTKQHTTSDDIPGTPPT